MTETQLKNIIVRIEKLRSELIHQGAVWIRENEKHPGQVHASCIDAMVCASAEMQDALDHLSVISD